MAVAQSATAKLPNWPRARPVEPMKPRRTRAVSIRLNEKERATLDQAAEAAGIGPSSFARMTVVQALALMPTPAPPARLKPNESARDLAQFLGALGKIGNNVNQLAHHLNAGWDADPSDLRAAVAELAQLRAAVLDKLSEKK